MRTMRVGGVLGLAVLALSIWGPREARGAQGPVKVGLLVPETGPLAANGKDMINGLQLFLEQRGYRLAGREVKLTIEDDAGVPATDLTKRKRSPSIVRTGWSSAQPSQPFGKWVHDTLHYEKIAMVGYDFAFGWE